MILFQLAAIGHCEIHHRQLVFRGNVQCVGYLIHDRQPILRVARHVDGVLQAIVREIEFCAGPVKISSHEFALMASLETLGVQAVGADLTHAGVTHGVALHQRQQSGRASFTHRLVLAVFVLEALGDYTQLYAAAKQVVGDFDRGRRRGMR